MYKISVVCPVYNCEKYLERTIESLLKQSIGFENLELIFVDDCSTDSSRDIIRKYHENYDNILLFTSDVNHGFPGFGRNYGIKKATAEYIMFIDNDDEYEIDFCEVIYKKITQNDVDMVCANHYILKPKLVKADTFNNIESESCVLINDEKFLDLTTEFFYLRGSEVWSKIFKKSIIQKNNISFIEKGLNEDTIFLYEYYKYCNKILFIDYYGYKHYRDGENLSYYSFNSTLDFINSFYELYEVIDRLYENVNTDKLFENHIYWSIIRIAFSYNDKTQISVMLQELYDFEKFIQFNSSLNYIWATIINNLLLKKQFKITTALLILMRKIKNHLM